jgi:hypothetical protein
MNRDMKSTARALRTIEKAKNTNEEVEMSEENHYTVAKGKQGWFVNQHTKNGVWNHSTQTGYHDTKSKAVAWAKNHAGNKEHKIDIKEEADKLTKEETVKENKVLTGVLNKLEEGRGRPASPPKPGKAPSAAWLRHLENIKNPGTEKPKEQPDALAMQLRRAKSVNSHVEFNDGKKHEVHLKHINAFDDHMERRRTSQEKHAFQQKASASHDAFVKAVSEPLPTKQDHGDHGFPKYRH